MFDKHDEKERKIHLLKVFPLHFLFRHTYFSQCQKKTNYICLVASMKYIKTNCNIPTASTVMFMFCLFDIYLFPLVFVFVYLVCAHVPMLHTTLSI